VPVDRALDRNPWNEVVARLILPPRNTLGTAKGHRLAALISQDRPYLPAAQHIARRSVIEERLTVAQGQFVNRGQDERVWNVLNADRLLLMQIVWVLHLRLARVGIWQGAVGIVDIFGERVGDLQTQPIAEPA
jgi:hypothetical protein